MNHSKKEIYKYFWSPENLDAFYAGGGRMIRDEGDSTLQHLYDKAMKGEKNGGISPKQFALEYAKVHPERTGCNKELSLEIYEIIGNGLKYAGEKGIACVADDSVEYGPFTILQDLHTQATQDPNYDRSIDFLKQFIQAKIKPFLGGVMIPKEGTKSVTNDADLLKVIDALNLPGNVTFGSAQFGEAIKSKFFLERVAAGDKALAATILALPATVGKIAVLRGSAHSGMYDGSKVSDLDEGLIAGGKRVGRVALTPNIDDYMSQFSLEMQEYSVTAIFLNKANAQPMQMLGNTKSAALGGEVNLSEITGKSITFGDITEETFKAWPEEYRYNPPAQKQGLEK